MEKKTIDRITPLVDEYTLAKIMREKLFKKGIYTYQEPAYAEVLRLNKTIRQASEHIMEILFDDNKEKVQQNINQ